MNTSMLETTDLFKAAFYLCMGGVLSTIRFNDNGKQVASFLFSGPDLYKHDSDYISGRAQVNPVQFREAFNRLRDILFTKLRDNKGRYNNDRKRTPKHYQIRRQSYIR